jgi:hypothetical protein
MGLVIFQPPATAARGYAFPSTLCLYRVVPFSLPVNCRGSLSELWTACKLVQYACTPSRAYGCSIDVSQLVFSTAPMSVVLDYKANSPAHFPPLCRGCSYMQAAKCCHTECHQACNCSGRAASVCVQAWTSAPYGSDGECQTSGLFLQHNHSWSAAWSLGQDPFRWSCSRITKDWTLLP